MCLEKDGWGVRWSITIKIPVVGVVLYMFGQAMISIILSEHENSTSASIFIICLSLSYTHPLGTAPSNPISFSVQNFNFRTIPD
jgi:hypothetical protein